MWASASLVGSRSVLLDLEGFSFKVLRHMELPSNVRLAEVLGLDVHMDVAGVLLATALVRSGGRQGGRLAWGLVRALHHHYRSGARVCVCVCVCLYVLFVCLFVRPFLFCVCVCAFVL